jgi:parvulin-like peptidyl-prolyl isomerase
VQQFKFKFLTIALLAVVSIGFSACGEPTTPAGNNAGGQTTAPAGNAATVNGKAITLAEVERAAKAQAGEQWSKLSPLELAQARLQVLQGLIQTEVLYQRAEAEKTIPSDDEITTALNKAKTESGRSAEEFQKEMEKVGETDATLRETIKKQLAINKLVEKISGKVEPPKDAEIEAFFKGNPEAFVKKKGVKLSAVVVDPRKGGEGDKTVDEASSALVIKEVGTKLAQGADFATVAREYSEDQSRANGGDLGYISEEQLKQSFPQLAGFMNPQFPIGRLAGPFNLEGKFYIFKLVERSDKDETLTLESPGVRQQITDALTNGRKGLVREAYAAQAMNEAKIDNLLLKKIIESPNDLSGARPASTPNANANANANANTANTNANANAKPAAANANANAKPAANTAANATNTANANK